VILLRPVAGVQGRAEVVERDGIGQTQRQRFVLGEHALDVVNLARVEGVAPEDRRDQPAGRLELSQVGRGRFRLVRLLDPRARERLIVSELVTEPWSGGEASPGC
jgi:hypothetical protein